MSSIEPGQVYLSMRPRDDGFRIRVTEVGSSSVRAVDAANGRPLLSRILLTSLHDSMVTKNGLPRRTGYALETAPSPAQCCDMPSAARCERDDCPGTRKEARDA